MIATDVLNSHNILDAIFNNPDPANRRLYDLIDEHISTVISTTLNIDVRSSARSRCGQGRSNSNSNSNTDSGGSSSWLSMFGLGGSVGGGEAGRAAERKGSAGAVKSRGRAGEHSTAKQNESRNTTHRGTGAGLKCDADADADAGDPAGGSASSGGGSMLGTQLIKLAVGDGGEVAAIKDQILSRILELLPAMVGKIEGYADEQLQIADTIQDKMGKLPYADFEQALHPVFQEDEWILILVGAVLGLMVGFAQIPLQALGST